MNIRIHHAAIWTANLERLKSFYVTQLGAVAGEKYANPKKGFQSYFLSFASGPGLEIMTSDKLTCGGAESPSPGYAHISLSVGSEAEVDALTERLRSTGTPVVDGPRRTGDGFYESAVLDPDGNHIEITV